MTTVGDGLYQYGGVPVASPDVLPASVHMVCKKTTSSTAYPSFDYWYHRFKKDKFFTTVEEGYAALTTGRNDVLYISPDTHVPTAASTSAAAHIFAKSNCHVIGCNLSAPGYPCSVVSDDGSTGTGHYNPLVSVTGHYNSFRNLRLDYGNATNTNLNALRVEGNGNLFENCYFRTPLSNTIGDLATFDAVIVGGKGNTFRNCIFGSLWNNRSAASSLLKFQRATGGTAARHTVFENCVFRSEIDNVGAFMIDVNSDAGGLAGPQFFRNCMFYAHWSDQGDQGTVAIRWGTAGLVGTLHFDANCTFWGFDDITTAGMGRAGIIFGQSAETAATLGMSLVTA